MIDGVLRFLSVLTAIVILHQIYFSVGGNRVHRLMGKFGMLIGVILIIVVAIRGAGQDVSGPFYPLHLALGGWFFVTFFATGLTGAIAYYSRGVFVSLLHKRLGYASGFLLIATLFVGLASIISH